MNHPSQLAPRVYVYQYASCEVFFDDRPGSLDWFWPKALEEAARTVDRCGDAANFNRFAMGQIRCRRFP